jgi:hypothetical protein
MYMNIASAQLPKARMEHSEIAENVYLEKENSKPLEDFTLILVNRI